MADISYHGYTIKEIIDPVTRKGTGTYGIFDSNNNQFNGPFLSPDAAKEYIDKELRPEPEPDDHSGPGSR